MLTKFIHSKKCIAVKNAILFSAIIILLTACSVAGTRHHPNLTPGINHVFLSVSNMDASIAFYTKAFDLKVVKSIAKLITEQHDTAFERTVKITFLQFPGQDFVLEVAERPAGSVTGTGAALFQHIGVEEKDIIAAFKRVEEAGGKPIIPIRIIRTTGLEIKQAFFQGPDGESIELVQVLSGGY